MEVKPGFARREGVSPAESKGPQAADREPCPARSPQPGAWGSIIVLCS